MAKKDDGVFEEAAEVDRSDRKWFELLTTFISDRKPIQIASDPLGQVVTRDGSEAVNRAEADAVEAALRAIERMAGRLGAST